MVFALMGEANHIEPDVVFRTDDVYELRYTSNTIGFIERSGNMYVALLGRDAAALREVGRSLSWDEAVLMLQRAHADTASGRAAMVAPALL